jgi:RNA polymerase sigma-70 factor (ECF subfamily)
MIALQAGDEAAQNRLVSELGPRVQVMLRARLRVPDLIQDAYQETFVRVFSWFRSGKSLENPASLPGLVLAVARNVTFEVLRTKSRHPQFDAETPDPPDAAPNPEDAFVTEERQRAVRQILLGLAVRDRILLQRMLEEEDKGTLCLNHGVNRDYLRVLLHRARVRFKSAMEKTSRRAASRARAAAAA